MKRIYTFSNWLIGGLLALLGVATNSCGEHMLKYGVPTADFQVGGQITERGTDKELDDIQVEVKFKNDWESFADTVYTDAEGKYFSEQHGVLPTANDSVIVTFNDTTGAHRSQQVAEKLQYKGGDHSWYEGKAQLTIDAELEKQ